MNAKAAPTKRQVELVHRRQEQILDAAARLFAERGFADTDTSALAAELKVGKGTLYRYFRSKRALFLAAADRVMHRLRQCVDDAMARHSDPFEQIEAAVRTFLTFCSDHPEFVELLVQERANFKDRTQPTYFVNREQYRKRWRDMYHELIASGRMRDIPVDRIIDVLSNQLYGTLFTNYFAGTTKTAAQQADDVLDVVFYGIKNPAERASGGAQ